MAIPASQINVLVIGRSCSGKSYLAGLMAELLTNLGYSTLVVDVEGEHEGLSQMRGVLLAGRGERLPKPQDVATLLEHRFGSVVLDLSLLDPLLQDQYLAQLPSAVEAERARTGLPHWVLLDEAHRALGNASFLGLMGSSPHRGYCLVTYRTDALTHLHACPPEAILVMPDTEDEAIAVACSLVGADPESVTREVAACEAGQAVLIWEGEVVRFAMAARRTAHVRHLHKYVEAELPSHLRFYFDDRRGTTAANLVQFTSALDRCEQEAVEQHCQAHDFSRWMRDVLQDRALSRRIRAIEDECDQTSANVCRHELIHAVVERYPM